MRTTALAALIVAAALVPAGIAIGLSERTEGREEAVRLLSRSASDGAGILIAAFDKTRAATLLTARNPVFADALRDDRQAARSARSVLRFIDTVFPEGAVNAVLTDTDGREHVRVHAGVALPRAALGRDVTGLSWFAPGMASPPAEVYQGEPYSQPGTGRRMLGTTTPITGADGNHLGVLHLELGLPAFRRQLQAAAEGARLIVVDSITGEAVLDTAGGPASRIPVGDGGADGYEVDGHLAAAAAMPFQAGNANRWVVVAVSERPYPGLLGSLGGVPIALLGGALLLGVLGAIGLRRTGLELRRQANSDGLTGLPNRRQLLDDLERAVASHEPALLVLLDLNGFKNYNDDFGHLAGDALLTRLGLALQAAVLPYGRAYRLGGDEFCVIARGVAIGDLEELSSAALSQTGEGFSVTASFGTVELPTEATAAEDALVLADQRMYRQKADGRPTARGQTQAVLLQALTERHPEIEEHSGDVGELAADVAAALGLDGTQIANVRAAAELHDIGKVAIPDAILMKPGPLDEAEWAFMRRHTAIGERILLAAPALAHVAPMVRSSHERWDGGGYPDALRGEQIPLGARIIAVCDSFDAMVSARPYSAARNPEAALLELSRCAGTQFDPVIVDAFLAAWRARADAGLVAAAA